MNNFVLKGVLSGGWRASVTTVRFRRVNVQRPRPPHFVRARVEALVKPIFPQVTDLDSLLPSSSCLKKKEFLQDQYRPDNPYERLIAKEIQCWFKESKLIAFLHTNPISGEDKFWANIKLKREDMHLRIYSHHTMKMALEEDIYAPVHQLFRVHQAMIFSKETKVEKLLKTLKKIPQYVLMAAIVDGELLSVSQLVAYSKLKDLTMARAQLAATLCLAQSKVISNLNHHQVTLVHQLKHLAGNLNSTMHHDAHHHHHHHGHAVPDESSKPDDETSSSGDKES